MMSPMDTRICRTVPDHLRPPSEHERTLAALLAGKRRSLWRSALARLVRAIPPRKSAGAKVSSPS